MLPRLASRLALATMAALVLVGCTPPAPSEEEVLAEARAAFEGFNQDIDSASADGTIEPADLEGHATPELAAQWASDIQASMDDGTTSRGVLEVVDVALVDHSETSATADFCTDGRGIVTTLDDGSVVEPNALVAWSATFARSDTGTLLLASMDPNQDKSICE